jgi:hypothetical protein
MTITKYVICYRQKFKNIKQWTLINFNSIYSNNILIKIWVLN